MHNVPCNNGNVSCCKPPTAPQATNPPTTPNTFLSFISHSPLSFCLLLFVVICYYNWNTPMCQVFTWIFPILLTNLSTYPQRHKKSVKMTIYINIYLYIFIMFMLCIYAHGTKSRKVHGQSIGQRNFLRVWLCIYNMKEFDQNLYRVIFGAKSEFWENP